MRDISVDVVNQRVMDELLAARSVVDFGGDGGRFIEELKGLTPEKVCVLVEPSMGLVSEVAMRQLKPDRVVETCPEVFVQDDRCAYDAIVCRNVLQEIDDLHRFLEGIYERLRPGGRVIILGNLDGKRGWKNAYTLFPERIDEQMRQVGFSVDRRSAKNLLFVVGKKDLVETDQQVI
jgi:SAM-dependent methyltransferase